MSVLNSKINIILICLIQVFQSNLIADNNIVCARDPNQDGDTLQSGPTGITILNGGVLNNQGTVILSGNLNNQNLTVTNLGSGTISMSDTVPQEISGQNILGNLMLNNRAGVNLSGNTFLNGVLTFNNGLLTLGSNNLLLGADAIVEGFPSANSMVVATGSGEFRKSFNSAGGFTFPVGDNTGIVEYSPVTLGFAGDSFGLDNYVGVNLVNSVYPGTTGSYLKRYWSITQSGITGFSCDAIFRYLPADLSGTENQIFCIRIAPDSVEYLNETNVDSSLLIATGLTGFGKFTGLQHQSSRTLNLTIFLESLYNGSGTMRQSQNESGPEFPELVADQISVELHDSSDYAGKILTVSNIDLNINGTAVITIPGHFSGSYYITIRHRNSIETTTAVPVSFAGSTISYSFDGPAMAFGNNLKLMADGRYVVYGGDVTQNGTIDIADMTPVDNDASEFIKGYLASDVNGDGTVDIGDMSIIDNNGSAFVAVKIP